MDLPYELYAQDESLRSAQLFEWHARDAAEYLGLALSHRGSSMEWKIGEHFDETEEMTQIRYAAETGFSEGTVLGFAMGGPGETWANLRAVREGIVGMRETTWLERSDADFMGEAQRRLRMVRQVKC